MTVPATPTEFERALFARLCGNQEALLNLYKAKLNWMLADGLVKRRVENGKEYFDATERGRKFFEVKETSV
jgi:hypothetical protein